jgi:lysophospholipase L1-like esterase
MGVESSGCHPDRLSSLGDGDIQPDVILIFMGTNDRGYRLPVYRERGNSITYFSGAYAYMLAQLASLYPAAERWCITLRQSGKSRPTAEHPVTDGYSQAIRDCAAAAGCRLIDLAACPPYDVFDPYAIHASAQGMKDISHAVLTTAMGWTE